MVAPSFPGGDFINNWFVTPAFSKVGVFYFKKFCILAQLIMLSSKKILQTLSLDVDAFLPNGSNDKSSMSGRNVFII